jgi:hypothetical protein
MKVLVSYPAGLLKFDVSTGVPEMMHRRGICGHPPQVKLERGHLYNLKSKSQTFAIFLW